MVGARPSVSRFEIIVDLVTGGLDWIGSQTMQKAWLSETIREALQGNRSVVIARERRPSPLVGR